MLFGIGIKDIIDILLVAFLMYQAYKLMKGTGAINIFIGIMAFIIIWFLVSYVFKMSLLGAILNRVVSVGAIGLIVIFQNEIRRFLLKIGSGRNLTLLRKIKDKFTIKNTSQLTSFPVMPIVLACQNMAKKKTGALIIIARRNNLQEFIESGETFNADINAQLIETVFFKNSPLHDGAMILTEGKMTAARCILPVSQNLNIPNQFGLRHRAAIGLTERTDSVAIIVSEETGTITVATSGHWKPNLTSEQLKNILAVKLKELYKTE